MTTEKIMRSLIQLLFVTSLIIQPASAPGYALTTPVPQSPPTIELNGTLPSSKTQRGRIVRATVVMNIPAGYHINSNHPLEKFLIATHAQIEAPKGIRVG